MGNTITPFDAHAFGKLFADPMAAAPAVASVPNAQGAAAPLQQPDAPLQRSVASTGEPKTVTAQDLKNLRSVAKPELVGAVIDLLNRDVRQLKAIVAAVGGALHEILAEHPARAYKERGMLLEHAVNGRAGSEIMEPLCAAISQIPNRPLEAKEGDRCRMMSTLSMVVNEPQRFAMMTSALAGAGVSIADSREHYRAIADHQGGGVDVLAALDKLA